MDSPAAMPDLTRVALEVDIAPAVAWIKKTIYNHVY